MLTDDISLTQLFLFIVDLGSIFSRLLLLSLIVLFGFGPQTYQSIMKLNFLGHNGNSSLEISLYVGMSLWKC